MVLRLSIWLRETGRLYLRYMAVALVSSPFAVLYVLGSGARWNQRVLLPVTLTCALSAAFAVWKWLGTWQEKRQVVVTASDTTWAELMRTAMLNGPALQYRATLDENILRTWQDVLSPALMKSSDLKIIELCLTNANRVPRTRPSVLPASGDVLQQVLVGAPARSRSLHPQQQKLPATRLPEQGLPVGQTLLAGAR